MSSQPVCDRIITYNNKTAVIPGYEGIPQNLLINVVSWTVLLVSFSFLRRLAWDYGRIALTRPKKNMWASLFYSEVRRSSTDNTSLNSAEIAYTAQDHGFCSWIRACFTLRTPDLEQKAGSDAIQYLRFQQHVIIFMSICMFFSLAVVLPLNIGGILKSPDMQTFGVTTISNLSGESRSLWAHVVIGFMFFVVAFLLMQHFSKQLRTEASHTRTTSLRTLMISGISRSNCQRDLILRHFREAYPQCEVEDIQVCYDIRQLVKLDNRWEAAKAALAYSQARFEAKGERPVMIPRCCGWSCTNCYRAGHCRACFLQPRAPKSDMRSATEIAPNGPAAPSNNYATDDHRIEMMLDHSTEGAGCCACCMCPAPVDAIDYYANEAEQLKCKLDDEGVRAVKTKIGIAFVTFHTRECATRVHTSYHPRRLTACLSDPPSSSLSFALRSYSWTVQYAPNPSNIIWANLAVPRTVWWFRAISVNIFVFLIVFFLTTPTYVLNLVNELQITERLQIQNPILIQFIPSIILWSVSALLPYIVHNSDRLVGHWTKSGLHLTVMAKTFSLLILMVLVLPSLGLTSIPALLQWLFPDMLLIPLTPSEVNATMNHPVMATTDVVTAAPASQSNVTTSPFIPIGPQSFRWECVFMPDNGAFFVNYVITSAFIGTALELVRFPELIVYACRIMCVRSQAEKAGVRKVSQWEFDFGLYYAWTLCVFAVVTSYSLLCPLITPFGLVYLILKHLVDRYNLFFAYLPSRIDARIHLLAMTFMLFAVLLLQLNLFMFIALRLGAVGSPLSIVALCGLVVSAVMWLTTIVTGWMFVKSGASRRRPESHHPMMPTTRAGEERITQVNVLQPVQVDENYFQTLSRSPVERNHTTGQSGDFRNVYQPSAAAAGASVFPVDVEYNRSNSLDASLGVAMSDAHLYDANYAHHSLPERGANSNGYTLFIAPVLYNLVDRESPSVTTSVIETEPD